MLDRLGAGGEVFLGAVVGIGNIDVTAGCSVEGPEHDDAGLEGRSASEDLAVLAIECNKEVGPLEKVVANMLGTVVMGCVASIEECGMGSGIHLVTDVP